MTELETQAFGSWIDERADQHLFRGVVLVWEDGAPAFSHAAGLAHRGHRVPVTLDTRFQVASVTKMVTATTALRLVERGALKLDRPLVDFLPPEYRPAALDNRHTLHHLLVTHLGTCQLSRRRGRDLGVVHLSVGSGAGISRSRTKGHPAPVRRPARRLRPWSIPLRGRQFHPDRSADRVGDGEIVRRRGDRRGAGAGGNDPLRLLPGRPGARGHGNRLHGHRRPTRDLALQHLQRSCRRDVRRRAHHYRQRPGTSPRRHRIRITPRSRHCHQDAHPPRLR